MEATASPAVISFYHLLSSFYYGIWCVDLHNQLCFEFQVC